MFNALEEKNNIVEWIKNYFNTTSNNGNAIIGISGGKDSTIVAALCVEALGKDRVYGILMPNGIQNDIDDARAVVSHLMIPFAEINIAPIYHSFIETIKQDHSKQTLQNLPPRIRMSILYAYAQSHYGRVANTCNLSENVTGYYTIWGDGAGDFAPLANYTATEVVEIGKVLDLPRYLVEKVPSDGLADHTDEDDFGFKYVELDAYLQGNAEFNTLETNQKILKRISANAFKNALPLEYERNKAYDI